MGFLESAISAERNADAAALDECNPFVAAGAPTPSPTLSAVYPAAPKYDDFDAPLEPTTLLQPEPLATWQKKLSSLSYNRPEEATGLAAMKILADWLNGGLKIDTDSRGFWLMCALCTPAFLRNSAELQTHCHFPTGTSCSRARSR